MRYDGRADLMSVSPPGWMRVTGGTQDIGNIDDAAFRERTMEYVRKIVSHYHTCPALDRGFYGTNRAESLN